MNLPRESNSPVTLLECCFEIFGQKRFGEESFAVYFSAMKEVGSQKAAQALKTWLRTKKHVPTPADILELAQRMPCEQERGA